MIHFYLVHLILKQKQLYNNKTKVFFDEKFKKKKMNGKKFRQKNFEYKIIGL